MTIFAATRIKNQVSPFTECLMQRGYLRIFRRGRNRVSAVRGFPPLRQVRSQSPVGWVKALRNPTHDIKKTEIL
ncbi:hypothetical protein [Brunnivagina elsteri]|uniref:Uncharacterized protein n=1 Tax=Brunnivagina elsteri CCALA 953 TaxID=987040 RepID=A0A2A2TPJ0_9CYAN|nr:hypothetical protein [Calothrix elsteri]PAX60352.1 hypothetical protein CK510_02250 [Calothrix elsteri CCALA 953]